ncbi:MAG: hypothetical protein ACHQ9S_17145 [Candidatus Binatia bacterium]
MRNSLAAVNGWHARRFKCVTRWLRHAWAPGYYSVLFADYVPGKGKLEPAVTLPLPQVVQMRLGLR